MLISSRPIHGFIYYMLSNIFTPEKSREYGGG